MSRLVLIDVGNFSFLVGAAMQGRICFVLQRFRARLVFLVRPFVFFSSFCQPGACSHFFVVVVHLVPRPAWCYCFGHLPFLWGGATRHVRLFFLVVVVHLFSRYVWCTVTVICILQHVLRGRFVLFCSSSFRFALCPVLLFFVISVVQLFSLPILVHFVSPKSENK